MLFNDDSRVHIFFSNKNSIDFQNNNSGGIGQYCLIFLYVFIVYKLINKNQYLFNNKLEILLILLLLKL